MTWSLPSSMALELANGTRTLERGKKQVASGNRSITEQSDGTIWTHVSIPSSEFVTALRYNQKSTSWQSGVAISLRRKYISSCGVWPRSKYLQVHPWGLHLRSSSPSRMAKTQGDLQLLIIKQKVLQTPPQLLALGSRHRLPGQLQQPAQGWHRHLKWQCIQHHPTGIVSHPETAHCYEKHSIRWVVTEDGEYWP